jgi:hypothetical protein
MTITPIPATITETDSRLVPLSEQRWCVLGSRVDDKSETAILGFICLVAGVYEVTTVTRPLDVTFCTDLRAAQAAVSDLC